MGKLEVDLIYGRNGRPNITPLLVCNFPSLRHMSVYLVYPANLQVKELDQLLVAFGKNLITFLDNSSPSDEFLAPNNIWLNCPNIRRIQSGFCWPSDTNIAPSLRILQISNKLLCRDPVSLVPRLPIAGLRRAGNVMVTFRGVWKDFMVYNTASVMTYVECMMDLDLSPYDMTGVKFQDFIVRMLLHRKAGVRRPAPGWDLQHRYF